MQFVQFYAVNLATGVNLPVAQVSVYATGTTNLAPLYDNTGAGQSNPFSADALGKVGFAVADGSYDIQISSADGTYTAPPILKMQIVDGVLLSSTVASILAGLLAGSAIVYDTQAHLYADLAHGAGTIGLVYSDGTAANNGLYAKSGASGSGAWALTGYVFQQPIHLGNLGTDITALLAQSMPAESGYLWAVIDALARIAIGVKTDGSVTIPNLNYAAGSITADALATALAALIPQSMISSETGVLWAIVDALGRIAISVGTDGTVNATKFTVNGQTPLPYSAILPETGYVFAIVDALSRIGFGITTSGAVTLNLTASSIPAQSIDETKITVFLDRMAVPHVGDVIELKPDPIRAAYGSVATDTNPDGTLWAQFPPMVTSNLRGQNVSGTSLQFRKSSRLSVRGKRIGAAFSPIATTSQAPSVFKGQIYSTSTFPPVLAGQAAGWYLIYASQTTVSYGGYTVGRGDVLVYTGSAWAVQKSPAPIGSSDQTTKKPGDFWVCSAAGAFGTSNGAVSFSIGDRIVYIGYQSNSGAGYDLWINGMPVTKGDLFYNGEFAPSSGLPASPVQGDLWQASAAGTDITTGLVFAISDYGIYDAGTWGVIPSNAVTVVASNALIPALACSTADEWEVRRTDKASTITGVVAGCMHQVGPRRSQDNIVCRSDSLFGVLSIGTALSSLVSGRAVTQISWGGSTSRDVLSNKEFEVFTGDPYLGFFEFILHGQNNQPGAVGDANTAQIIECSLKLRDLLGARDKRYCFLSVPGVNSLTWNGTRLVSAQYENDFGNLTTTGTPTSKMGQIEYFYSQAFPGQWLSPRLFMQAAAGATLDTRVNGTGMTEAQTAAAYGWIPQSFFLKSSPAAPWPFTLTSLTMKGYWNATALPTGGSPNDCYTRNGTGGVAGTGAMGNLLVNVAGTWGEYAYDAVHLGPDVGGPVWAAAMNAYLTNAKI